MISVLIPVFNSHIFKLVQELSHQFNVVKIKGEIIVFDDFSDDSYRAENKSVSAFPNVFYKELEKNFGRVEIRKLLVSAANYDWLLFIDGDSKVLQSSFIAKYVDALKKDFDVIAGGRIYSSTLPADCGKRLHWRYGKEREKITVSAFQSNNFCIRKSVFHQLQFPKEISGYGHEDSWIGIRLEQLQKKILYINNPVLHEGVEDVTSFLKKTHNALHNLYTLSNVTDKTILRRHVKLYNAFYWQKKLGLSRIIRSIYKVIQNTILKNLASCYPSLLFFDFYRLNQLIEIEAKMERGK
jgi:glycosyltransferase involved in cell wall biosynthesis